MGTGAGAAIVVDDNITTTASATARATAVLRRATLDAEAGELVAPPHVGQEIGDVIAVSDATLGLDAARYRVTALRFDYAFAGLRGSRSTMTLDLGRV